MVRHLRSVVVRMTSELDPSALPEMRLLVQVLTENAGRRRTCARSLRNALGRSKRDPFAFVHGSRSGALNETLRSLYHTASIVRDRISADTWRIVNQLDLNLLFTWPATLVRLGDALLRAQPGVEPAFALSGLITESMTRGPGWRS